MTAPEHKALFDHGSLEAAKWAALATMTIDHYGKIVAPTAFIETHAVGRLAFPLLAGILGIRLAVAPGLAGQYLRRLLPWAVIAQPIFVVAGRDWLEGNILFTLALGVLVHQGAMRAVAGDLSGAVRRLLPVVPLAFLVEFGPIGVLMPAATVVVARAGIPRALLAVGPLGVLANVVLEPPVLTPIDLWALPASAIAWASPVLSRALPRLPSVLFYAYYPAHLLVLHWLDLYG